MKVAVYSNVRTTVSAQKSGWTLCFNTAFRAGAVMGFALCGLGIFMLYVSLLAFRIHYPNPDDWILLTECLTGYGLGGSCIAMFGRVGGGIYTKAADVGADLVGKVRFYFTWMCELILYRLFSPKSYMMTLTHFTVRLCTVSPRMILVTPPRLLIT